AGSPPSGRIGAGDAAGGGMPGAPALLRDEMAALADATGGRAYAFGEIAEAVTSSIADGQSSYRIAYQPSADNWDGKRHTLAISSARAAHILAPKWYIASPSSASPIPDAAILSPFDQSDLGVSAALVNRAIQARVDPAGIVFAHTKERYRASLVLQLICYTPDQRRRACTPPIIRALDLSASEYAEAVRGGLRFPFEPPEGEAPLKYRVIVRDENSGAIGTATIAAESR